jgi:hypothetical protein
MSLLLDGTSGITAPRVNSRNGGTGLSTLGVSGNVLQSNGTAWQSAAHYSTLLLIVKHLRHQALGLNQFIRDLCSCKMSGVVEVQAVKVLTVVAEAEAVVSILESLRTG